MSTTLAKPFAYSYSRLAMFESCRKKYYHTVVAKDFPEPESNEMREGKRVHKALEDAVKNRTYPPDFKYAEDAQRILDVLARKPNAAVLTEQQLAITRDMQKCNWFARAGQPEPYLRVVVDLAIIDGEVAVAVDWKTGKVKHETPQLMLTALVLFINYPQLKAVRAEYGWLKTHVRTGETYYRDRIMMQIQAFQPRITAMEQAHLDGNFPAEPGFLCAKWCPVRVCPHHGG
jgi:hypothetical protein